MREKFEDHCVEHRDLCLLINRAEVRDSVCSACGARFAESPAGERTLIASVSAGTRTFFFCAACGDNILGHVQLDDARGNYVWDWAIPLRETNSNRQD
jgi:hypothetical protein